MHRVSGSSLYVLRVCVLRLCSIGRDGKFRRHRFGGLLWPASNEHEAIPLLSVYTLEGLRPPARSPRLCVESDLVERTHCCCHGPLSFCLGLLPRGRQQYPDVATFTRNTFSGANGEWGEDVLLRSSGRATTVGRRVPALA